MKNIFDEDGQAVLLVMMMALLFFLLSTVSITAAGESRRAYLVEKTMVQAYYVAEAGVERALIKAKTDSEWLWLLESGREVVLINDEEYANGLITKVTIKKDYLSSTQPLSKTDVVYTNLTIKSEGIYDNSKKTLVVKAQIKAPLRFLDEQWTNKLEMEPGATVITGKKPVPVLERLAHEKNYDEIYMGNKEIAGWFNIGGILYVNGDLHLSGQYSGIGTIIASGNIYITDDLQKSYSDPNNSLAVISFGQEGINVAAGKFVQGLLYASPGDGSGNTGLVRLGEAAQIHGGIICDKLIADPLTASLIQYDRDLAELQPDWTSTEIVITEWRESFSVF